MTTETPPSGYRPGPDTDWEGGDLPTVVDRQTWLEARRNLLAREKALTRERDAVARARRHLPMVEVRQQYVFSSANGPVRLLDLFKGRRQLVVCHFMFHPGWTDGCASCTAGRDDELGPRVLERLRQRDTEYVLVSRARIELLERWRHQRGWMIDWYSTDDGDFSYDFGATIDPARGSAQYNYTPVDDSVEGPMDLPGRSCFLRIDDRVFHTYSHFARATEETKTPYSLLDLTVLGRQEVWEEPANRVRYAHPADPAYDRS